MMETPNGLAHRVADDEFEAEAKQLQSHGGRIEGSGRPRKAEPRDRFLQIRLTAGEVERIKAAGGSSWARTVLLAALEEQS